MQWHQELLAAQSCFVLEAIAAGLLAFAGIGGQIVEQQRISELKARALRRVKIIYSSPAAVPLRLPGSLQVIAADNTLTGTWTGQTAELVQWLATQPIDDATIEAPDLGDLFLAWYRESESSQ